MPVTVTNFEPRYAGSIAPASATELRDERGKRVDLDEAERISWMIVEQNTVAGADGMRLPTQEERVLAHAVTRLRPRVFEDDGFDREFARRFQEGA